MQIILGFSKISKGFYEICQFLCTTGGAFGSLGLHHDPDQGLCAGGPHQDAAVAAQGGFPGRNGLLQGLRGYWRQSPTSWEARRPDFCRICKN